MWLVILLRIIGPVSILRYPLIGGIFAILLDYIDLQLLFTFDPNHLNIYQPLDKFLDMYYLTLEFYMATKWQNILVKRLTMYLFIHRLIGIILFEFVHDKYLLVIFPNVFEYIYLLYLTHLKIFKRDFMHRLSIVITSLFIVLSVKVFHEYLLHINTVHPWDQNKYVKMILNPDLDRFL